jgi:pimeloyl-ACP methyl ester carboxylesterase
VLLPTGAAGAGWFMASQVLSVEAALRYPVRVRGFAGNRVTLSRTPDTARSIPLAFVWPGGHAELGTVVTTDRSTVVREVSKVTRGTLQAGLRGHTSAYLYGGDPHTSRGLEFADVEVTTPLGPMPAWFVPGSSDVWVIAVHGRGAPRGEVLRILPTLTAAGHPVLAVTYRNDLDAPPSPDRMFHLGDTEWEDVDAAIEFARARGAKGIILYGWSMGGATVLNLQRRRAHDDLVRAMILDCPVIDWTATLQMNARSLAVPAAWAWTAMRLLERRIRVRLADLDQRAHAGKLDVPTLLFVDHDDNTVAPWPTVEFAKARPDLITLVETRGAGHCRSWNLDRELYEKSVTTFLAGIPR